MMRTTLGSAAPVPTQYLKGFWPMHDGSGNSVSERSAVTGNFGDLDANGTVSAGFWTNPYKPSFEAAATDYLSDGSLTQSNIGHPDYSFIVSMRVNIAATTATACMLWAKQNSSVDAGVNLACAEISSATKVRSEYKVDGESSKNVIGTTAIDDGNDHHIIVFYDRGGNRGIWVDGADDVAAGVVDMSDSILVQTAAPDNAHFIVGARGITGAVNGQLASINATQKMKVWDVQLYEIEGSLPANYATYLMPWMYKHPYQFITSDMW